MPDLLTIAIVLGTLAAFALVGVLGFIAFNGRN